MMLPRWATQLAKAVHMHRRAILTGFTVGGAVMTAWTAVDATVTATDIVRDIEEDTGQELTKKEIVAEVWPEYVKPGFWLIFTIGSCLANHWVSSKDIAGFAALYAMSQSRLGRYRQAFIEHVGEEKERQIRSEIAAEEIAERPPYPGYSPANDGENHEGLLLFHDNIFGGEFWGTINGIRNGEIDINNQLLYEYEVTLNEIRNALSHGQLEVLKAGGQISWEMGERLTVEFLPPTRDKYGRDIYPIEYNLPHDKAQLSKFLF